MHGWKCTYFCKNDALAVFKDRATVTDLILHSYSSALENWKLVEQNVPKDIKDE